MNIDEFRSVADRRNAIVTVDLKSAQVRVRSNNFLNRAILWLQRKFSSNPSRSLAVDAAHNRFLQAIGDRRHSGFDATDVSRARDLLTDDLVNRRPLSSRRIREVLDVLIERSDEATRTRRRAAAARSDATNSPNMVIVGDVVGGSQNEEASLTPSPHRYEPVAFESVPEPRTHGEAEETEPPIPPSDTEATTPDRAVTGAAGTQQLDPPQAAEVDVGAAARKGAGPKGLARELTRAKLPGEVSKFLKKEVRAGRIVDMDGLANQGNKRLAEWVKDNRIGRWYVEARNDRDVRRGAKRDGLVNIPIALRVDVVSSIADSPVLKHYPDVKVHARALCASYVKRESTEVPVEH